MLPTTKTSVSAPFGTMLGPKSIQRFLHLNKGIPHPTRSHGLICREEGQSSTNKSSGPLPGQLESVRAVEKRQWNSE